MVHSDYHGHGLHNRDVDPKLRAKVIVIGVFCFLAFWGFVGFVAVSLL
jgi:hypothetical protein